MFCSHQRQIKLLSINIDVLSNFLLVDYSFIFLVDSGKLSWIGSLLLGTNSLVPDPSREHRVCPENNVQFLIHQRQIKLLSINTDVLSNFLLVDSSFIFLVDSGKLLWIRSLLLGTNSLVHDPSREHHVCFLTIYFLWESQLSWVIALPLIIQGVLCRIQLLGRSLGSIPEFGISQRWRCSVIYPL